MRIQLFGCTLSVTLTRDTPFDRFKRFVRTEEATAMARELAYKYRRSPLTEPSAEELREFAQFVYDNTGYDMNRIIGNNQ